MEQMNEELGDADPKSAKGYAKRKELEGFGYDFSPHYEKPKGGIFSYFSRSSKPPPPLEKNQHPKIDEIVKKAREIQDLATGLKSQTGGKRNTRTRRRRHTKRRRPTKRRRTKRR